MCTDTLKMSNFIVRNVSAEGVELLSARPSASLSMTMCGSSIYTALVPGGVNLHATIQLHIYEWSLIFMKKSIQHLSWGISKMLLN